MRNPLASAHIPEEQLALYSRGDLGFWARLAVSRHIGACEQCSDAASEYARIGEHFAEVAGVLPAEISEASWESLAEEMTANIRLGMAAGECVSEKPVRSVRPRLTLALAGVAALFLVAVTLHPHSSPVSTAVAFPPGVSTLEASNSGIEVRGEGRLLSVPSPSGRDVLHTVNTHGDMRSRYVDDTGVTIVDVYADAE